MGIQLTYEKAKEIMRREFYNPDFDEQLVWTADGFIRGWESRQAEVDELTDALCEMVGQHCYVEKSRNVPFELESNCLHANADAMRLLGKIGKLKIDDRGMRVVFGNWPKEVEK
jgi:hypothetical protein